MERIVALANERVAESGPRLDTVAERATEGALMRRFTDRAGLDWSAFESLGLAACRTAG